MFNKYKIYLSREAIVSSAQFATRMENEFIKKSKGILHIGAISVKKVNVIFSMGPRCFGLKLYRQSTGNLE